MAKAQKKVEAQEATEVTTKEEKKFAMNADQTKVVAELTTVSARIRYLSKEGYTRSEITKLIPNAKGEKLIYQHVNNVLKGPTPKTKS